MSGNKFLQAPYIAPEVPIVNYVSITDVEDNFLQAPTITQHLPDIQTIPIEFCSTPGNQNGYASWEEDPIFTRSPAYKITQEDIDKWNRDPVNYESWTLETLGDTSKTVDISSKEKLMIEGVNLSVDLEGNKLTLIGEDSKYTGTPTIGTVGGIPNGTIYSDKPILSLIDELLHSYIEPTIFNFSILSLPSIVEVGIPVTGVKTFVWDKTSPNNIKDTTGSINNLSSGEILKSGINLVNLSRTTSMVIIDNTSPFNKSFNINGQTTKNKIIVSNTFNAQSVFPIFIGSLSTATPSENDILNMTRLVVVKSNQTFNYTIDWQHFAIAYSGDYGDLKSIKDTNGFEIISGFIKLSMYLTINGISELYIIYISILPTTQTNFNLTYSFN